MVKSRPKRRRRSNEKTYYKQKFNPQNEKYFYKFNKIFLRYYLQTSFPKYNSTQRQIQLNPTQKNTASSTPLPSPTDADNEDSSNLKNRKNSTGKAGSKPSPLPSPTSGPQKIVTMSDRLEGMIAKADELEMMIGANFELLLGS
jgi:hypothetical protein